MIAPDPVSGNQATNDIDEANGIDSKVEFISNRVKRGDYYFLDLNPDPASPLSVVCGGREVCDENYLVDRKDFSYYSLEFVASGKGLVSLAGRLPSQNRGQDSSKTSKLTDNQAANQSGYQTFPLAPGTVFCYGPGIPHRIEAGHHSAMVKYFVDFSGREAESLATAAFPDGTPWVVASPDWIQRLFEDLKNSADNLPETRSPVCALIVRQVLVMLADRSLSGTPGELDRSLRFRNLKARLRELALQGYGLEEAARASNISPSYLSRLFRRFDTETPQRWMVRCRMTFAASLLLDPRLLVKEVATLTGYEDQYHFSRTFKAIYGHSPDTFRRMRH
jgi:AraC-like DNA-binding protein